VSGMADTTTAKDTIEEQYKNLLKAQTETLSADYENSRSGYENQLEQSDSTYQPLRNEAYVNKAMAERTRKENMANMGLSGEGGTSLSLQQRNTGNLLSTLGDISQQQQSYADEINLALANLDTTYNASVNSVTANVEAQRIAALLAQNQFDQNYDLSEQSLAETVRNNTFNQYYELYKAGRITKRQFEQQTGTDLK